MNDVLADRLSALVDTRDDSNWRDVRRRARRSRPRYVAAPVAAAAAAAVVAAAALGAGSGWLFTKQDDGANGSTQIRFHDETWSLMSFMTNDGRWVSLDLVRAGKAVARASGGSALTVKGVPQGLLQKGAAVGPAFGARFLEDRGGQIWFGDARPEVASIQITDRRGRVYRTTTAAPQGSIRVAFRLWVVGLPASTAVTIAGFDARGRLVDRRPVYSVTRTLWLY
jgi:hypothetical protein